MRSLRYILRAALCQSAFGRPISFGKRVFTMGLHHIVSTVLIASSAGRAAAHELKSRYDVVVVGAGVKESLLAGLLASHGKQVLHLEGSTTADSTCLDLQQLADLTEGQGATLSEQRVGKPSEYSIELSPKVRRPDPIARTNQASRASAPTHCAARRPREIRPLSHHPF